jgi:hypothetical protein
MDSVTVVLIVFAKPVGKEVFALLFFAPFRLCTFLAGPGWVFEVSARGLGALQAAARVSNGIVVCWFKVEFRYW